jgi:signal transduction histidine kinase
MKGLKNRFANMPEGIRLITVILFFLFVSPGLIIPRSPQSTLLEPIIYYVLNLLVCSTFIGLEILEYAKWSYHYTSPTIPRALFTLRFFVTLIPSLFMGIYDFMPESLCQNQIHHIFMLFSLLPFYAYYAFSQKKSLFLLVSVGVISLMYDILVKNGVHSDLFQMGFSIYRTLTTIFFYFLAWLLEKQQTSSAENKKLLEELKKSETQLRDYADRIGQTVALEERTRLAQDIHDSLGHSLTVVKIQQNKALAYLNVDLEESEKAIMAAKASAEDAMSDIRSSLKRLNGGEATISLLESLPLFVNMLEENGLSVDYHYSGDERGYNYSVLMGLYRLVQEGTTNILKHASPTSVTLYVDFGQEGARLELSDNGKGFTIGKEYLLNKESEQYGLKGLVRRIELVNGSLEVDSTPGKGTKLTARVPRNPLTVKGEGCE